MSGWLKGIKLTREQERVLKKNIEQKTYNGKVRAAWTKKKKKKEKINLIYKEAKKEYYQLKKSNLFLVGLTLYWAEGNKKTEMFQFTNSDPRAVKITMDWLLKICKISKKEIKPRLYIHKIYAHENCEKFWSKITKIPVDKFQKTIFKPTTHKTKKNPFYKGCIQLRVLKIDFYRKVMGWLNALAEDKDIK